MSAPSPPTRRCPTCGELFAPPLVLCPRDASVLEADQGDGPDPLIGRVFGNRFAIEARLGEGGMGAVYRATQLSVGREVALKVLHPSFASRPDAAQRFAREARMLSRLHHPSVVTLFDFGQAETGELFLAMELLQGETLGARLERGALDVKSALAITAGIADALAVAHADGIVHRDLKPDNVWLLPDPNRPSGASTRVKVLDFGLARTVAVQTTTLTGPGTLFGTPAYMSPEAIAGREVGPPADLYALGLMLFEMLMGRKAFVRDNIEAVFTAQLVEPAPPLPATFPRALSELVRRLLEKEPARRLGRASDLQTALIAIDETSDPQRVATNDHKAPDVEPPSPSRRGLLIGGAVAVIALAAIGAALMGLASPTAPHVAIDAVAVADTSDDTSTSDTTVAVTSETIATIATIATVATTRASAPDAPDTMVAAAPDTTAPDITSDTTPDTLTIVEADVTATAPRRITLSLGANVAANVTLDGKPLGTTPLTSSVPLAKRSGTLVFTRADYKPVTRRVRLDADQNLTVELERKEDFIVPGNP